MLADILHVQHKKIAFFIYLFIYLFCPMSHNRVFDAESTNYTNSLDLMMIQIWINKPSKSLMVILIV